MEKVRTEKITENCRMRKKTKKEERKEKSIKDRK